MTASYQNAGIVADEIRTVIHGNVATGTRTRPLPTNGISLRSNSPNSRVVANTIDGYGGDGIRIQDPKTFVAGNVASHNGDLGIDAVPGVTDGGGNRAFANGNPLQCLNVACSP